MQRISGLSLLACSAVVGLLSFTGTLNAQDSVEEFYAGKSIDFIIGYSPGGAYDQYARLVARHMQRYIPGNPHIIVRNMPGGGSRTAVNYVYSVAPKDGTVLATADQGLALYQAMGDETLGLNVADLNFVGNPIAVNNVVVTWHSSGIETIEDARQQPVTVGSTGSSTSLQYPMVMNAVLGTQFEIIVGYPGGNDINFAMESGEVEARGSNSWASYKATTPRWLEEDLINVIVQIGLEPEADLPDVPLLIDFAETEEDRAMLMLLSTPPTIGRPIFTTPGVPEDRLDALRAAFDAVVQDADFLAEAAREGLDIAPVNGQRLQEIVADIIATPPEVGQRLEEVGGSITQ